MLFTGSSMSKVCRLRAFFYKNKGTANEDFVCGVRFDKSSRLELNNHLSSICHMLMFLREVV